MFQPLKVFLSSIGILLSAASFAQNVGDLVVTPTKVELTSQSRSADVTVLNKSNTPLRYRLSLVDMSMNADGSLQRLAAPSANSAASMIRIAPREILLAPGESQRVKILITFPEGTPEGEFRSHISFDCLSNLKTEAMPASAGDGLQLNIRLRTVVSIPVFARNGNLTAAATLTDLSVDKDKAGWLTKFHLNRSGNRSIRGDISVVFDPKSGGREVALGHLVGLPVYCPNAVRNVSMRLDRDPATLGQGTLKVTFLEGGRRKGQAQATTSLPLGN